MDLALQWQSQDVEGQKAGFYISLYVHVPQPVHTERIARVGPIIKVLKKGEYQQAKLLGPSPRAPNPWSISLSGTSGAAEEP